MAISSKSNVALVALCFLSIQCWAKDMPPMVKIHATGVDYVVFDVSGADTVDNLPVKSINVNYTRIASVDSHPTVNVQKHVLHSKLGFDRMVNITNLNAGDSYKFQFYVTNTKNEKGPNQMMDVLLKPQTPDFSITHQGANALRLFWGYPNEKQIDYFLLTVEKESAPGCGFTLNFTRCFGSSYDLANIEQGQTYNFKFVSHNPSGYSEAVQVYFPYD